MQTSTDATTKGKQRRTKAARTPEYRGLPWLWAEYVNVRSNLPVWVPPLVLFVVLEAVTWVFAVLAGNVSLFLREPHHWQ